MGKKDNNKKTKEEYIKTGISGFDKLFEHGIPYGSSVLIEGSPGTGKTIFCLQVGFNACKQGKRVLYMSFEEKEDRLRKHMKEFGWDAEEMEKKGLLRIKRFSAIDIARSVEALLSEAKRELLIPIEPVLIPKDFTPDVVLVDSLTSIASAFTGEEARFRIYMEQLFRYLEKKDMSSFLIKETARPTHTGAGTLLVEHHGAVSFLADGIICMYNVVYPGGTRGAALEVLKLRGENFKKVMAKMEIKSKKGILVYPDQKLSGKYDLT
jgi:circadian clock protein KaiC